MKEFLRTSRNLFLFLIMLALLLFGVGIAGALLDAGYFRHPWTWILPFIGFAIEDGIFWLIYRKSSIGGFIRVIQEKRGKRSSS